MTFAGVTTRRLPAEVEDPSSVVTVTFPVSAAAGTVGTSEPGPSTVKGQETAPILTSVTFAKFEPLTRNFPPVGAPRG